VAEKFLNGAEVGAVREEVWSRRRGASSAVQGPQLTLAMRTYFLTMRPTERCVSRRHRIVEGRPLRCTVRPCHSSRSLAPGAVRAEASIFPELPEP